MIVSLFRRCASVLFFVCLAPAASAQNSLAQFSGLYWGVSLGWGDATYSGGVDGGSVSGSDLDVNGPTFGLLGGVAWERGRGLWGFEWDITGTDWFDTVSNPGDATELSADVEWIATIRGRYGRSVSPNWMIYGTAGLAYADVSWTAITGDSRRKIGIDTPGLVFGVGAEHVLGNGWNGRVEGQYYRFSNSTDTSNLVSGSAPGDFAKVDDSWTIRLVFLRDF
ncbi:MAG: porin family protein [Rhodobacteraceae bacterium]|nr:porin family protein [Paracoccaceae bacterium]